MKAMQTEAVEGKGEEEEEEEEEEEVRSRGQVGRIKRRHGPDHRVNTISCRTLVGWP